MSRSPAKKPLEWSEIALLALLAATFVLGAFAKDLSLSQVLAAVACGATILLIAKLGQGTPQRPPPTSPPTCHQRAREVVVFLVAMAALAGVAWWCVANREEEARRAAPPARQPPPADDQHDAG